MSRKIKYWSASKDVEVLQYETINDAVEDYLDGLDQKWEPEILTVYGFADVEIKDSHAGAPLAHVLECLDEQYQSRWLGRKTEPTDDMRDLEEEFIKGILGLYKVGVCERVTQKEVNVKEWIKKNKPSWLDGENDSSKRF